MKKLIKGALFLALVGTIMVGCEKDESQPNQSSINNQSITTKTKNSVNKSAETMTYTINREDIEDEVLTITDETFNSTFLSENPNSWVTIVPSDVPNQMTVTIMPNGDDNGNPVTPSPDKIVCSGSGYSFASCVSDWFDNNPDGCLAITQSNGTYSADDEGC